jgi:hypothetical protein
MCSLVEFCSVVFALFMLLVFPIIDC